MLSASASFLLTRGATRLASKPVTIRRAMSTVDLTPYKVKAQEAIDGNDVMIFAKSYCPHCKRAKEAVSKLLIPYGLMNLDLMGQEGIYIQDALLAMSGQKTVPNVFVKGVHVGGGDKTVAAIASGEFQKLLSK